MVFFSLGNRVHSSKNPSPRGSIPLETKKIPSYAIDILSNISPPEIESTRSVQNNPNLYTKQFQPNTNQRDILRYNLGYYKEPVCEPPSSGSPSTLEYSPFVFDPATQRWCNKT